MMMLEIVVTHYREEWKIVKPFFEMLSLQRRVDFGQVLVRLVHDGTERFPKSYFDGMPFRVVQDVIKHGGVSAARNRGIEKTQAKWLMFCDCDDLFPSIYSLCEFMNVLGTDDYDMLWSRILSDDNLNGKRLLFFVLEKQRFVFCHGKVYRAAFLRENGIRFDTRLVFNEDSCFNGVIIARTSHKRIGEITSKMPLYAWIRRDNSVTNSGREDEASYGHFRRNMIVTAEYENGDDRFDGMVTRTAYDTYYMVFGKRNSMQMRRRIVDEFTPWIAERIESFGRVSGELMEEIRQVSRMELVEPGEIIPDDPETVGKWVRGIVEIYRKVGGDGEHRVCEG